MTSPLLIQDPAQFGRVAVLLGGTSSEREVSLDEANAFHYRSDNQERRVTTECSRHIAHEKSKEEYEQWRTRMSGPTPGCAECKVPYD